MGFVLGMAALGLYYAGVHQITCRIFTSCCNMLITVLHMTAEASYAVQ